MTLRAGAYRFVLTRWVGPRLAPREFPAALAAHAGKGRAWFHAASVGELESLWTVIQAWLERSEDREAVVTILSESAKKSLEQLKSTLGTRFGKRICWAGYSPWEGRWGECLRLLKPSIFVTAKYEAWPELWMALAEEKVPLAIVGASDRRSLRIARGLVRMAGMPLPRMILLPVGEEEGGPLRKRFPEARVECVGEARWDRVQARNAAGNARARSLIAEAAGPRALPRPWGIFGSFWPEDFGIWAGNLRGFPGTLWIVPHRLDEATLAKIEKGLQEEGLSPARTSRGEWPSAGSPGKTACCILVDEMGFLSELYSAAEWAYVGGGFGSGVHSTIEPALHGIPISIGPKNAEKFPEIRELRKTGELSLLTEATQARAWIEERKRADPDRPREWKRQALSRLGATERIVQFLEDQAKS